MPVVVTCRCSAKLSLKDELRGRTIQCPKCGAPTRVAPATVAPRPKADPAFEGDVFLIGRREQERGRAYDVADEAGAPRVAALRPPHLRRELTALLAAVGAGVGAFLLLGTAAVGMRVAAVRALISLVTLPLSLAAFFTAGALTSRRRSVTIYRDAGMSEPLLQVTQDAAFQPLVATFSVRDVKGRLLARFRNNHALGLVGRGWSVRGLRGETVCVAKDEDTSPVACVRRYLASLVGAARTNFILVNPKTGRLLGAFKRRSAAAERFTLDLRLDSSRMLERPVAVALAVLLDENERR
jgi:hypothetical protein